MEMQSDLLEILACPQCHGALDYRESENRFLCHTCRLSYAIQKGIPVLLVAQASPF